MAPGGAGGTSGAGSRLRERTAALSLLSFWSFSKKKTFRSKISKYEESYYARAELIRARTRPNSELTTRE